MGGVENKDVKLIREYAIKRFKETTTKMTRTINFYNFLKLWGKASAYADIIEFIEGEDC